jgi:hypothetical protein
LFRKKSKDKQTATNYRKPVGRHKANAHKRATALFAEQTTKLTEERLSAKKVKEAVDLEYSPGYSPSPRTIQRYVKEDMVGVSPVKSGRASAIQDFTFKTLVNAFETYVVISQINGQGGQMSPTILSQKVKAVMGDVVQCSTKLMRPVIQETTIHLMADKLHTAEQWRTFSGLHTIISICGLQIGRLTW